MDGADDQWELPKNEAAIQAEDLSGHGGPFVRGQVGNSGGCVLSSEASVECLQAYDRVKVGFGVRSPRAWCISETRRHCGHRDPTISK